MATQMLWPKYQIFNDLEKWSRLQITIYLKK